MEIEVLFVDKIDYDVTACLIAEGVGRSVYKNQHKTE